MQIVSIFEEISQPVFSFRKLDEAQNFIIEFVDKKKINEKDKQSILKNVREAKNITRLQTYICNSLLKYESLSLNSK